MPQPITEYRAEKIAERLVDEFLISTSPNWAAVHDEAELLRDLAARELRNQKRQEED